MSILRYLNSELMVILFVAAVILSGPDVLQALRDILGDVLVEGLSAK